MSTGTLQEASGDRAGAIMRFLKDNSLSLAFFALFLACLVGQVVSGYALQGEDPAGQSHSASLLAYLVDPSFLKGVFSNWQAALLQLLMLVILSVSLRQKGASHSRKPDDEAMSRPHRSGADWFGKSRSWIYGNSLSLTLLALFAAAFLAFFLANAAVNDAQRARVGEEPLGLARELVSADFWFQAFQTWQAEFFAMGAFLILTVFLRQKDSAESKPVGASDQETGETNE